MLSSVTSSVDSHDESRAARFLRLYSSPGTRVSESQEPLMPRPARSQKPWYRLFWSGSYQLIASKMNILLVLGPIALFFRYIFPSIYPEAATSSEAAMDAIIFVCSIIVLCPLAERLGFITEELALYTNDTLGGLLNATFGNATELIICAFSLKTARDLPDRGRSYLRIVQLSLLGSVLGNLLLVLGCAFLVGGLAHPTQSFNQQGVAVNHGLLVMAVGSILLPSTLAATHTQTCEGECSTSELALSRFESLFMLGAYTLYLVFQLFTHKFLFEEGGETNQASTSGNNQERTNGSRVDGTKVAEPSRIDHGHDGIVNAAIEEGEGTPGGRDHPQMTPRSAAHALGFTTVTSLEREMRQYEPEALKEESTEPEPVLGVTGSIIWLTIVTLLISWFSELVIETIETASEGLNVPMPFLSTIVLPIVGNAAEHASAIMFAYKNRMEVTLGVAVGSSTQIAVFVIPFTVVLAWIMQEDLDLNFKMFEAFTLFLAVLLTVINMNDGTSNWLKGMMLMITYVFISAAFWLHKDVDLAGEPAEGP